MERPLGLKLLLRSRSSGGRERQEPELRRQGEAEARESRRHLRNLVVEVGGGNFVALAAEELERPQENSLQSSGPRGWREWNSQSTASAALLLGLQGCPGGDLGRLLRTTFQAGSPAEKQVTKERHLSG